MKKVRSTIALVLVLCLMLPLTGGVFAADGGGTLDFGVNESLMAGAGNGEIVFPDEMFPLENFMGIHDNPYARILVLESESKVAIVSLELTSLPVDDLETCKEIVNDITGTPKENIWIHCTHNITSPHVPTVDGTYSDYDEDAYNMYMTAVFAALTEAAQEAADSFQPAEMGVGTGDCDVNVNRNIETSDGYTAGLGGEGPSNKTMTILRVDSLSGDPIGFLMSYGVKPTAIDISEKELETRLISSDLPGYACVLMEEEFGVPALFCMPGTADQVPKEKCLYNVVNEDGTVSTVDLGIAAGLEIVERLGTEMAEAAINIANDISCDDSYQGIDVKSTSFTWANKNSSDSTEVMVDAITIGDLAFVGLKQEVDCATELELWEASPYEHTLLVSFMNGDAKYMPHAEAYDINTYEVARTSFAKGAAEEFVSTAVKLLGASYENEPVLLHKFLTDVTFTDIITDAALDKYFEGSALEGVEAILESGNCYVNGYKVPVSEEECGDAFEIMGYKKLYKDGDGWAAENNKRTGTTFEDARLGMVEALSRTTGIPVYIYDTDGDGYADMIDTWFYAVVLVDTLIYNEDDTISVDRGDFKMTVTNLDVNEVDFPKDNVDASIEEGDFAMFWQNAETGWWLEKMESETGYLTDAADHQYYVFNDVKVMDGMHNPKASINTANRPGQYANAHLAFGLDDVEITFWLTKDGNVPSGFTSGDHAASSLERAIAYCEALMADVAVSEDGTNIEAGSTWVTSEEMATYKTAIDKAKAALANEATTNSALDTQIYNLFIATWGSTAKIENIREGIIPGGFLAAINEAETTTVTPYIAGYPDGTFAPDQAITRAEAAQMLYNIANGVISEPIVSATGTLQTATVSFSDISSGKWYYDAVTYLANTGVISGYPDGSFGPDKTITRAEFTAMVVKYMGLTVSGTSSFPDVSSSYWAAGFIAAAKSTGLVVGYPNGDFGPEDSVTRAQTATILNHMLERDTDGALFTGLEMPFSDVSKTHWAYNQIMAAAVEHTV